MADTDSKVCRVCGQAFPRNTFHPNSKNKDGRSNVCRACHNKLSNERYHRTKVLRPLSPALKCAHCGKEFPRPQPKRPGDPPRCSTKHCSVECRFWSKVDKSGGPDACWNWTAKARSNNGDGYGMFGGVNGRGVRAHRFAWELTNGPITDGLHVCHKCDNPLCCNPSHFFLGAPADNFRDMIQKGRDWNMSKDPALIERLRAMKIGKPRQPEVREKLRLANLGHKPSAETVAKVAAANRGKKRSEETRQKMREAQRQRRAVERGLGLADNMLAKQ